MKRFVAVAALLVSAGCATTTPVKPSVLVWPLPPEAPRIRYVESLWHSDQFKDTKNTWLMDIVLGPDGKRTNRMVKPFAVTTDAKGRVYVTDTGLSRVWVFDREKKEVRFLGDSGQGQLVTPSGVAVDARGIVYVSDTKLDRVFAYDEQGKVVLAIGQPEEFYSPSGLAIDQASKRLYVADAGRHKIRVYDTESGKFLFEFGTRGTATGQFNYPTHLFLAKGVLYVTDTMNFRVQVFALDGRYLRKYGEMGANFGQLARPKGVAVDSEGHVYVVDAAFGNVQIFSGDGDLLLFVGQTGFDAGQFFLPAGMHIDAKDRVYVVDQYNRRVQVFDYLGKTEFAGAESPAAVK
ncbi:MAG: 6-bladed beta-propeller [Candidatus Rokubacteria bacterium]|nr:6-bladed beta-propeller [Candidatus Rokubacteria bacterium]